MLYSDRFIATDNLIAHLNTFVGTIADPIIQANYAGFLSVSSVTVYELAIKDIFNEFALKKNKVFGTFITTHFSKINSRVRISELRGTQIKLFGEKYLKKFDKILNTKENSLITSSKISITTDYGNLITCRHEFVHNGAPTLTINEVINCYKNGKEVIHCLHDTMKR